MATEGFVKHPANWGLVIVIALAAYLSWKMVGAMRESFQGAYNGNIAYAAAEPGGNEPFAELSEVEQPKTDWGDGTPITPSPQQWSNPQLITGVVTPSPTQEKFAPLLAEPAYGRDANALFVPSL